MGEDVGVCGGGYGNSVHSAQLCCEPKSALKIKYLQKKSWRGENEVCYVPTWG